MSKPSEHREQESPDAGFWLGLRAQDQPVEVPPARAGGKAANLARLASLGLPTPNAIVLTTDAWHFFLDSSSLRSRLEEALTGLEANPGEIPATARKISGLFSEAVMPEVLEEQISDAYSELSDCGARPIAVRSSGSYEDSPDASFSGMLSTVLGVRDVESLYLAVRKCWASGFNPRGLRYLLRMGLDPSGVAVALIFQEMVEARSSGVLFTVDPATGESGIAVLEAAYGYGPGVVSGQVTPDLYRVDKKSLEIVHRDSRPQEHYYGARGERRSVKPEKRERTKLSDEQVRELVSFGIKAEEGLGSPQDIEWCLSPHGIVLLQTRPVTGLEKLSLRQKMYDRPEIVMVRGIGVSPRVGWGEVVSIDPHRGMPASVKDKVVVLRRLTQDLAPSLKDAAAVVADEGGATSHGANILREFQVPCVVGVRYGREVLHDGDVVTVDGWRGLVLDGIGPRVKEREFGPEQLLPTRTKLMTTINVPETAGTAAGIADGVISFRNDYLLLQGGVHPRQLLKSGKGEVLTTSVLEALQVVATAFRGKQVWYKTLDAPTDEFRRLRGGEDEPLERNPLLGWRGIRRELEDSTLLRAEYEAVRRAVESGCENLGIKVPFVRSVDEYERARQVAIDVGLKPHENIAFGASIETPAAAMTVDLLLEAQVDFFSVGINDLTMCCLGVDRESERVADLFDTAHPAVIRLLEEIAAHSRGKAFLAAAGDIAQSPALMEKLVRMEFDAIGISLPYLGTARAQVAKWEEG
ncbi:MAG: PEP-utilizing enzyme [Actinobacteria bacterium]|nr:PEP-utilizing enzyme [Actinomycetota bacterium]MCL5883724.1 PEP-utilizing enzyme [Actinomycetota bacterium]